ncbi:MAG: peptide ABC transporter substrate-binding protein [Steroidobacteraceae bacterium]
MFAILLALGLLFGSSPVLSESATGVGDGGIFRSGHPGEPDSLDPHRAVSAPSLVVNADLFEGLTALDARGRPVAGAAESWSVSPDGREYTFRLRRGLTFSDGTAITADDFIWSLQRLADPATAAAGLAPWVDLLENGLEVLTGARTPKELGVRAKDPLTLSIRLSRTAPYFPAITALPAFAPLPRHVIERHGNAWTRPEYFVSNGPFVLDSWIPGQVLRTRKNPRFHDAANVRLAGVEYHPINDLNAGLRRFQTGQLDALTNFPPERLDWLRENMPRELRLAPSLGVTVYVINHRLKKFKDPRVRRALTLSIDRQLLTDRLVRAGDQPTVRFVPADLYPANLVAGVSRARAPALSPNEAMLAQARALLRSAGYGPDRPLTVEILYHASEEHQKVALAVAAMWKKIGVIASLRKAERQVVEVATRNGEFEIARAAWFAPYEDPEGYLSFLKDNSPTNGGAWRNETYENLLRQAAESLDPQARLQQLREAEKVALNDVAVIPLYYLVSRRLVSDRVEGWRNDNITALRPARWLSLKSR